MENTPNTPREILGNTKPKSVKELQKKLWCFTFNNYTDELTSKLKCTLNTLGNYIFGYEVGENGTPHLQGFINLHGKKSLTKLIKDIDIKAIHFEACKGSIKDNEKYCTKDNKYESNYYKVEYIEELEILDDNTLFNWQTDIINIIKEKADKRKVYWYWEPNGNVGKSTFCKYLCHKYNATYIDEGKKADLINIIYNIKIINSRSVIVIDVPRANGNKVSYKAIEQIKNGMICNTKYETGMKLFNSPHLIIFANAEPNLEDLSLDRWEIVRINPCPSALDI